MATHRSSFCGGWLWLCSAIIAAGVTCALGQNSPTNNRIGEDTGNHPDTRARM